MKKLSSIIALTVLFASISLATPLQQTDKAKTSTQGTASAKMQPPKKMDNKHVPKKASTTTQTPATEKK